MTKPSRGKNKKQKQGDNGDVISEIWRKIHNTGEVTEEDISQLYMICKPVCSGCRVNAKDNPNCFCALIPPPNGSRKSGLWQKMSDVLQSLGPDPNLDLRASDSTPAGLTNLGATCYANSILQCLYMNKSFREGIFSVEPDVLQKQPVLDQLTRLFVLLHVSKMAFIDSSSFVQTLELDNEIQQDSHEFLTLLLSLLESCLSHSKIAKAKRIVQDLFRGSVSHVTTCSQCGRESEASSKMEDFYGLELNIKGLKGLDESLDDYLAIEKLHGDNQYFCDSCKTRVDATRRVKLCTLPEVLNFQLKRYIFLPQNTIKKKVTSSFSFPAELDMRGRLSEPSQSELIYDLSAVLIHKGNAVNSGHYIAHIKDEKTGQWWEFDDEKVTHLGCHPFGTAASSSSRSLKKTDALHSNGLDVPHSHSSLGDTFSSSDAYMLMYQLKNSKNVGEKGGMVYDPNFKGVEGNEVTAPDTTFINYLFDEIQNFNASYLDSCKDYNSRKELELNCINERRHEVQSVLAEAPTQPLEQPYFWICSDWLRQWVDNINSNALDNTSIQCSHGKVPVSKVTSMKRLSAKAWEKLLSKYGGGPTFSHEDCCWDCLIDGARNVVSADRYRDQRESFKLSVRSILDGNYEDGMFYVSKTWLQQWCKRKAVDGPSKADAGPTAAISCPHGQLMPEQAVGAKRLLVPESFWLFLYKDAISVKPDDPQGCPTFPLDSRDCSLCINEIYKDVCFEDSLRLVKQMQRQNHEKLFVGKCIPLSLHCKYFLVPSLWISKWRNYINLAMKNSDKPETLDRIIDSVMCEKHSLLIERPPELIYRRGAIISRESVGGLTIITENDWKLFCEEWGGIETKGISATIENFNELENVMNGSSKKKMHVCEDEIYTWDKMNNEGGNEGDGQFVIKMCSDKVNNEDGNGGNRQFVIKTCPEVCESCIKNKESCDLMQKLNYCDKDITVIFVYGDEVPKSILDTVNDQTDIRRISKRPRKTKDGSSINLKVSASTSIYQLKMMIWEYFGVVKENQILQKGDKIIDFDNEATLGDANILAGDQVIMRDSQIHENRDIADDDCGEKKQPNEGGFHGTLLLSSQIDKHKCEEGWKPDV